MPLFLISGLLFFAVAVSTAAADDPPLFKITTNPKSITVNCLDVYRN